MVDRYDPKYKSDLGYEVNAWMDKDSDGDWVSYSDYEALEAKLAALEKLLQAHQTRGNTTEARREDR